MATIGFGICLLISIALFIYMGQKNYDNIDIYSWTLVVLIPIIILAYWLKTQASTPETAKYLFCFIYLDSTVALTVILFAMLRTLGVNVRPWVKIVGYGAAAIHMGIVSLCVNNTLYYKSLTVIDTGAGYATKMTNGPLKIIHYVYLGCMFACLVAVMISGLIRKGTYSRRTLVIFVSLVSCAIVLHMAEIFLDISFSLLPYLYVVGEFVIAIDYDYAHTHDIEHLISNSRANHGARGFAAIGPKGQFLGCNEQCYVFLPDLRRQRIDERISCGDATRDMILGLIDGFERDENASSTRFCQGEMICVAEISRFSTRKDGKTQGYLLDIRDATEEQRAYDIITSYNETLNSEVVAKTNDIRAIQRKIVLGMADMIENRDNNTGGHVKRTSDIIHIIVDEIIRQGRLPMSETLAKDIVRAAPTHDLGKITIDSSILNKPGRLTEEEFAVMKTHAAKSGENVHILLDGVEEERFVNVAFNVARYHHERWDGRGYPDGLVGTMIPLEARIMAIADVYDALVSERCYKKPMSFEQAREIMCENMGTQFDPNLKSVFLGCREQLEQYYRES